LIQTSKLKFSIRELEMGVTLQYNLTQYTSMPYHNINIVSSLSVRVRFMVFNVISTIFQLHRGGQLHRWRKLEHSGEKTTDLPQVTGKLNHIMLYQVCELTTLVVIGTKQY
jgi:hypothetical protein